LLEANAQGAASSGQHYEAARVFQLRHSRRHCGFDRIVLDERRAKDALAKGDLSSDGMN
jgi:hypothetical protein